jgi:urocanate hydratase
MMTKQITIWISEELLERVRVYAKNKTGSSKALSGTINKIMEEYLSKDQKKDPPTHSDSTHTHETKKGIEDIMEFIEDNYPQGITKQKIEEAIKEFKGMDTRTIRKYEPEIIKNILLKGYQPHPKNSNLFLRDNMTLSKPEDP